MDVQTWSVLAVLAGTLSTSMFVFSNFPMLIKAFKTKDLRSYSRTHLVFSNVGNLIHWVYIVSLPLGPIWFLHGFFTVTTALMLVLYLYYARPQRAARFSLRRELRSHPQPVLTHSA